MSSLTSGAAGLKSCTSTTTTRFSLGNDTFKNYATSAITIWLSSSWVKALLVVLALHLANLVAHLEHLIHPTRLIGEVDWAIMAMAVVAGVTAMATVVGQRVLTLLSRLPMTLSQKMNKGGGRGTCMPPTDSVDQFDSSFLSIPSMCWHDTGSGRPLAASHEQSIYQPTHQAQPQVEMEEWTSAPSFGCR